MKLGRYLIRRSPVVEKGVVGVRVLVGVGVVPMVEAEVEDEDGAVVVDPARRISRQYLLVILFRLE